MNDGSTRLYNVLMGNPSASNAIGRTAGRVAISQQPNDNFFAKRARSIDNAIGTTGAALASDFKSGGVLFKGTENIATDDLRQERRNNMNDIAKKYGYNSWNDWQDAYYAAQEAGDTAKVAEMQPQLQEFQAQANANAAKANEKAANYNDVSKRINQDRGKFLGSAINTLSTAVDIAGLSANPLANAIQGGVEGVADELEQSGFENFDATRAAQNAAIGAATGAVTGALNKGISNSLAKKGGNFFRGGNALTRGLNDLGSKTALGRVGSTLATGAARGAVSGAVGGATGAGLSSALNGVDFGQGVQNALQGAVQGAGQGALTGGIMAGANMAISNTPGVGKFYNELQSAKSNWDKSGRNFDERLTNTLTSGDSAVGDWLMNKRQSKVLGAMGNIGNSVRDYTEQGFGPRKAESKAYDDLVKEYYDEEMGGIEGALRDAEAAAYPGDSNFRKAQRLVEGGSLGVSIDDAFEGLKSVYGDDFNPDIYLNKDGSYKYKDGEPYVWTIYKNKIAMNLANKIDAMDAGTYVGESDTPTTAKGWLKRAGERIVEDANNRGVGLSLKDVSGETAQVPATQADSWYRLAQQYGYNDYDEVIRSYIDANPGVELNPNGAAGQILTWLDENQNTPTTARGWLKRAGERIVEDANERGVGLSLRDGAQESEVDQDVFQPEDRNQMVRRNKAQLIGEQLENVGEHQKRRALYGSLDGGTAQRATETKAPETLSRLGIEPENYLEAAKTSNYINQVVSDLAEGSDVKIMLPEMTKNLLSAADNVTFDGVDAPKKFDRAIKQIVADGSTPDEYSAGYLLEASRDFGNKAAGIKGNSNDARSLRTAYTNAKYILRDAAAEALANANVTGDLPNENIAKGLAKMGANQKIVDYYTEPINGKAPTVRDYIRRSSLFEQARDMGTQIAAEKLTRSASKEPTRVSTKILRASGLEEPLEIVLNNTIAPAAGKVTKLAGKAIRGVGDLAARVSGDAPATTVEPIVNENYNPATQIYNAIGRYDGERQGEEQRVAQYLTQAVNDQTIAGNTLEGLAAPLGATTATTGVYNAVMGNTAPAYTPTQSEREIYFYPPTGDYWTDMLSQAMRNAKNAEDYDALGSLYEMYQDAVAKNTKTTTSDSKLTDKQRQAYAAERALNDFEQEDSNFAYDVSDIPVIGGLANLGGNTYKSKAEALALQIGYMLSGATVNREEAKNIGMAYVPQPRDNEAVRRSKLAQLRGIISDYQRTYAE